MPVMDSSLARNLSSERRATPVGRWGPVSRDQVPSSGRCRACLGFITGAAPEPLLSCHRWVTSHAGSLSLGAHLEAFLLSAKHSDVGTGFHLGVEGWPVDGCFAKMSKVIGWFYFDLFQKLYRLNF